MFFFFDREKGYWGACFVRIWNAEQWGEWINCVCAEKAIGDGAVSLFIIGYKGRYHALAFLRLFIISV